MNRRDAARLLARRYPGGIDALAPRLGKRADTLRKELTGVEGYKWGVDDEEQLMELCRAAGVADPLAPLSAGAINSGALLIPLPQSMDVGGDTWNCLAEASKRFGTLVQDIGAAVADNTVTANELRTVEADFGALVSTGQSCLTHLRARHEEGKPAHLREVKTG